MTGFADGALRAAVLKTLADDVGEHLTGTKDGLLGAMQADGVEKVCARLPDGTKVASLPLCGGDIKPKVTDRAAFLAWVKANRPGEIVESVRDSFTEAVLDDAEKAGRAVSRDTGDVIPGIEFAATTPYVQVLFIKGDTPGRELIRRAHRNGQLDMLGVALALPSGNGNGAHAPPAPAQPAALPATRQEPAAPRPEPRLTTGQVGILESHRVRLGFAEGDPEWVATLGRFAGADGLTSAGELTQEQALAAQKHLGRVASRAALETARGAA